MRAVLQGDGRTHRRARIQRDTRSQVRISPDDDVTLETEACRYDGTGPDAGTGAELRIGSDNGAGSQTLLTKRPRFVLLLRVQSLLFALSPSHLARRFRFIAKCCPPSFPAAPRAQPERCDRRGRRSETWANPPRTEGAGDERPESGEETTGDRQGLLVEQSQQQGRAMEGQRPKSAGTRIRSA